MRWWSLYLRSRRVPAAAGAVLVTVVAGWSLGQSFDDPRLRLPIAVLAAAAATVALGPGLTGADPALERTAALPWRSRRAAHALIGIGSVGLLLTGAALIGPQWTEVGLVVRNAAGLGGLVALGAAGLGADRAWLAPLIWVAPAVVRGPVADGPAEEMLTWMVQPPGSAAATVTAAILGCAGILGYAAFGGRR